jgi:hypothetical protein
VSKSIIAGDLIGHDDRRLEKNLNENLVRLGLAEPMDEPTFSEVSVLFYRKTLK